MNISSANYCQHEDGINSYIEAVIDGVTMSVPLDPDNRHYAAILKWAEKDGNTIAEAD
tara:strand:- start:474 stop:647 length:174 start_codon:yes stop_codon:yes gene_type:complete